MDWIRWHCTRTPDCDTLGNNQQAEDDRGRRSIVCKAMVVQLALFKYEVARVRSNRP